MAAQTLASVLTDPLSLVSILGMICMFAVGIWRGIERQPDEIEILLARGEGRAPHIPVRNIRRDSILGSLGSIAVGMIFLGTLPSSPRPGIVTYPVAAYLGGMMFPLLLDWAFERAIWLRTSRRGARTPQLQEEE